MAGICILRKIREEAMAGNKGNEWWLILLVGVVAIGAFFVLSSSKTRPAAGTVSPDILAEPVKPAVTAVQPIGIKSAHSEANHVAAAAVVKPVSMGISPLQQVPSKESFAVQVNSFKDKARADVQLEKLKAKGLKAYVMGSDLGARGIWYRVRVGSFATETEARAALEVITINFGSGIIVTE